MNTKKQVTKIQTVEDLCNALGCSLEEQEVAQVKLERVLSYLSDIGVIESYKEDKLDWVFSTNESY